MVTCTLSAAIDSLGVPSSPPSPPSPSYPPPPHSHPPNYTELTEVGAASDSGTVPAQSVLEAVRPNTVLVSVMLANNETGVVQPVGEVVEGLRRAEKGRRIFVHTDAAQARGRMMQGGRGWRV